MINRTLLVIISLFCPSLIQAQLSVSDQLINALPDTVNILGLGDPTHYEGTITTHRVELMKRLVQEKEFGVIAFEANLMAMYYADQQFRETGNPRAPFSGMYDNFASQELLWLFTFIEQARAEGNNLILTGFDVRFSGENYQAYQTYLADLFRRQELLSETEQKQFLAALKKANRTNLLALLRNDNKVREQLYRFSGKLLQSMHAETEADRFLRIALKGMHDRFAPEGIGATDPKNAADLLMADQLAFLQAEYPHQKIILFGSSTHLLKAPGAIQDPFFQQDRKTFGQELNKRFGGRYYFVAYEAGSGEKFTGIGTAKLDPVAAASPAGLGQAHKEQLVLTDQPLNQPDTLFYQSRMLGHQYNLMDLSKVCDALLYLPEVRVATQLP